MNLYRLRVLASDQHDAEELAVWDRWGHDEPDVLGSTLAAAVHEWPEHRDALRVTIVERVDVRESPRGLIADLVGERARTPFTGRCDLCGARCYGNACPAHRDLVQNDLSPVNEQTPPRSLAETHATGSESEGA